MSLLDPLIFIKNPRKHLCTGTLHLKVGSMLQAAHGRATHPPNSHFIAQSQETAEYPAPWKARAHPGQTIPQHR